MYNQNTAVFKSALILAHRTGSYPVRRECATDAPPPAAAAARIAHPAPSLRGPRAARYAREHALWGRGFAAQPPSSQSVHSESLRLITWTRAADTGVVRLSSARTHAHFAALSQPWLIHLYRSRLE